MQKLSRDIFPNLKPLPIKIIQFGDGNFLRGFTDFIIDKLNTDAGFNAGVVVVKARQGGSLEALNTQQGLYTLFTKGISNGQQIEEQRVISCIQKAINPYEDYAAYLDIAKEPKLYFLFSNTTEAGIVFNEADAALNHGPHQSFPAKVAALLYARFKHFNGDITKGLNLIPCELIKDNSSILKQIILRYAALWQLEDTFAEWVTNHNYFYNTLVDRIVPGYPKNEIENYTKQLQYNDSLIVTSEAYLFWAIEGDDNTLLEKIPLDTINENIVITKDIEPYRTRKVRILNGAHTLMVPIGLLYGNETVRQAMSSNFTGNFIKQAVLQEIIPTINLPQQELIAFSNQVFDRFSNPFIQHNLASIALNSISKFKVRVLPVMLNYYAEYNKLPLYITYAFACLIYIYKEAGSNNTSMPIQDDARVIDHFKKAWELNTYAETVAYILQQNELWDTDLSVIDSLENHLIVAIKALEIGGVEEGFFAYSQQVVNSK
jgi:tagaturonate reductase